MATLTNRGNLPLINQGIAKTIRSGVFRSKTPLGPATTEAITRGTIGAEAEDARKRDVANQQLLEDKRQADLNASLTREKIEAERAMQRQRIQASRDQEAAERYDAEKAAEPSFFDGLMGS